MKSSLCSTIAGFSILAHFLIGVNGRKYDVEVDLASVSDSNEDGDAWSDGVFCIRFNGTDGSKTDYYALSFDDESTLTYSFSIDLSTDVGTIQAVHLVTLSNDLLLIGMLF